MGIPPQGLTINLSMLITVLKPKGGARDLFIIISL